MHMSVRFSAKAYNPCEQQLLQIKPYRAFRSENAWKGKSPVISFSSSHTTLWRLYRKVQRGMATHRGHPSSWEQSVPRLREAVRASCTNASTMPGTFRCRLRRSVYGYKKKKSASTQKPSFSSPDGALYIMFPLGFIMWAVTLWAVTCLRLGARCQTYYRRSSLEAGQADYIKQSASCTAANRNDHRQAASASCSKIFSCEKADKQIPDSMPCLQSNRPPEWKKEIKMKEEFI